MKNEDRGLVIRFYLFLEDYCIRLKKKCKEDVGSDDFNGLFCVINSRIVGVIIVFLCGGLFFVEFSRGLKRKIGCIDFVI